MKNRNFKKKPSPTTKRGLQIDYKSAQAMLSIMKELSDQDAKGNVFSCVVISDAGIDPKSPRKNLETQELEKCAVKNGIDIAQKELENKKDQSVLVITDCENTVKKLDVAKNNGGSRQGDITIRHVNDQRNSNDHKTLGDAAHELCQHVRKKQRDITVVKERSELEAIQPALKIFR